MWKLLSKSYEYNITKQTAETCEGVFAFYLLSSFGVNHSKSAHVEKQHVVVCQINMYETSAEYECVLSAHPLCYSWLWITFGG